VFLQWFFLLHKEESVYFKIIRNLFYVSAIEVTFVAKLVDIEWNFMMVYNNGEQFEAIETQLRDAVRVYLLSSFSLYVV